MLELATSAPKGLPLADPQFWIVTLAALGAGGWIFWRLIPKRLLRKKRGRTTRATLTVGGKAVGAQKKQCEKCH